MTGFLDHLRARVARRRTLGYRNVSIHIEECERLIALAEPTIEPSLSQRLLDLAECAKEAAEILEGR